MSGPVLGLLLAAGAGRRMGTPKVLLRDGLGVPFVARAIGALLEGGCTSLVVVTGAAAHEATAVLRETGWADHPSVQVVSAPNWQEGMGASLRCGLEAAGRTEASCAVVSLVDLPDVGSAVVQRLLQQDPVDRTVLARAAYDGMPGHPVLLGRDHWAGVTAAARGDRGARDYFAERPPLTVECGDLATGRDRDTPDDL